VRLRAPAATSRVTRVRAVPIAVWLGGLVILSAAGRFAIAVTVQGPAIFPDEIIYSELAKSIGSSGGFFVRDVPFSTWTFGPVYALLLAPAYLIPSLPDAYLLAKAINSVVMSLAAVPTYLLARRVVDQRLARIAAVFAVLLPAMAFSSRVMTESAFYPVFLFIVLATVRVLENPTAKRQLTALGLIGMACLVRVEAFILVPALLTTIAAQAAIDQREQGRLSLRSLRSRLHVYRATTGTLLVGTICLLVASGLAGSSPATDAWTRADDVLARVRITQVPAWLVYHAAELDLALGVIPFAAFILLLRQALGRRADDRPAQIFVVTTLVVTGWLLLLAATFASQADVNKILERYVFYVEPLFLIALLAWIKRRWGTADRYARLAVAGAAALPFVLYFASLFSYRGHGSTPGLMPWLVIRGIGGSGALLGGLTAMGAVSAYLLLRATRRESLIWAATFYSAICALLVAATFVETSRQSANAGLGGGERAWIDRAVGHHADVTAITSVRGEQWQRYRRVWVNEFFNRSLGSVYYLSDPPPFGLPATRVRLRGRALITHDGRTLRADYVLSDGPVVDGTRIASQPGVGLALYRVGGPVRVSATAQDS
jgi:hypothetical protein